MSRIRFADDFFASMEPCIQKAYAAMAELEAGSIANPDEARRVATTGCERPPRRRSADAAR